MAKSQRSPYARIRDLWLRLSPLPGGTWLFSRLVGWSAPYTRTIGAKVVELSAGHAKVVMRDRWAVRNHLRSIHAIALMNMGELTTGLALTFGLPDDARGIPTRLTIEFVKKARGRLTSECRAPAVDHRDGARLRRRGGDHGSVGRRRRALHRALADRPPDARRPQ